MGGEQTDRRLGEKLTKLGRGPAELTKDLVSGGNVLTWKQVLGVWSFLMDKNADFFCRAYYNSET